MSYFVIKGPAGGNQYLCSMPGQPCMQWYERKHAKPFPDEDSAWRFLEAIQKERPDICYQGRVIRVNTLRDWKAERAQLRADRDNWRAMAEMHRNTITELRARQPNGDGTKEGA